MKKTSKVFYTIFAIVASFLALLPVLLNLAGSFVSEHFAESVFSGTLEGAAKDAEGITSIFSIGQYTDVLIASPDYLFRFWNSVALVVPVVIFQMILSSLTAYGLSQGKGKFFSAVLLIYLVLMMLPKQVTVIPNYYAVKELGLLNTNFAIWLPGIFSPFSVYLLTKYMKRVPKETLEAARLDGAGEFRLYFHIMLPAVKGELIALSTLVLVDTWNQVELPLMMFSDAQKYPLSVYLSMIRENAAGISFASSMIYMIPVVLLFLYASKELERGVGSMN